MEEEASRAKLSEKAGIRREEGEKGREVNGWKRCPKRAIVSGE